MHNFNIPIARLALGVHTFVIELADNFLANYEGVDKISAVVHLRLEKTTMLLDAVYQVEGEAVCACDRCLEPFAYPLTSTQRVIYSYDKSLKDADDADVVYIERSLQNLNIRQDIYDLVGLLIPLKKVPADCPSSRCPASILKYIQIESEDALETPPDNPIIDERWAALRKLLPNN